MSTETIRKTVPTNLIILCVQFRDVEQAWQMTPRGPGAVSQSRAVQGKVTGRRVYLYGG